ncbi:MAG: hypothetical protein IJ770_00085 [Alphaproteobacteria bacterium]|nr:hypothetical protein [Alphaproteobacteria bacterium]
MKQNENGRTMIEMLGVLAIIGVLSVMGIAGYNKAISKNYINQSISHITQMAQHTRIAFGSQRNYSGLGVGDEVANVMFTADLAPKDMLVLDSNGEFAKPYVFKNKFKGVVSMRSADKAIVGDQMAFIIHFDQLPKAACVDIAIADWGGTNGNGYVGLVINQAMPDDLLTSKCTVSPITQRNKATYCTGKGLMPVAAAVNACTDQKNNMIELKFY